MAIDLAARNPSRIHALILENTFTSLVRLISLSCAAVSHPCSAKSNSSRDAGFKQLGLALSPEMAIGEAITSHSFEHTDLNA